MSNSPQSSPSAHNETVTSIFRSSQAVLAFDDVLAAVIQLRNQRKEAFTKALTQLKQLRRRRTNQRHA